MGNTASSEGGGWSFAAGLAAEAPAEELRSALQEAELDVHIREGPPGRRTLLHVAASANNAETVKWLLEAGLDREVVDGSGETALHHAVRAAARNAVRELLLHGCDVDRAADHIGTTALMMAAAMGEKGIVVLLLDNGADAGLRTKNRGDTAARKARDNGYDDIAALLDSSFVKTSQRKGGMFAYSATADTSSTAAPTGSLDAAKADIAAGRFELGIERITSMLTAQDVTAAARVDMLLARAGALEQLGQVEAARADFAAVIAQQSSATLTLCLQGHARCAAAGGDIPSLREAISDIQMLLRFGGGRGVGSASHEPAALRRQLRELEERLSELDPAFQREIADNDKTHYEVLYVAEDADRRTLHQAYRHLSLCWHPDKWQGWADARAVSAATARLARINAAYEVLNDNTRRVFYDMQLQADRSREEARQKK